MSSSVRVDVIISGIQELFQGINELRLANEDLRALAEEKRYMKNCSGEKVLIDYQITNEHGEKIGITQNQEGEVQFVVEKETKTVQETLNKVAQAYSRIKILNEVKQKGYKQVKEEKLANGSIRLVVEKWR